jgi:hypothetical protein
VLACRIRRHGLVRQSFVPNQTDCGAGELLQQNRQSTGEEKIGFSDGSVSTALCNDFKAERIKIMQRQAVR